MVRIKYIIKVSKNFNCLAMVQVNPKLYYSIAEESYRALQQEVACAVQGSPDISDSEDQDADPKGVKRVASSSSSIQATPAPTGKGVPTTNNLSQSPDFYSNLYPSPMKSPRTNASDQPSEDITSDQMQALACAEYIGDSPTGDVATALLELEISKAMESSRLWVHVGTHQLEDARSNEIRMQFWTLAVHGIPPHLIKHLYIGDMAGLLLALIPMHEGRVDELQATAVANFDKIKKQGTSFLLYSQDFKDAQERMVATGIIFPEAYIRLKFILGMKTDPLYKEALISILSHRPAYTLLEIIEKLQGYAQTFSDHTNSKARRAAFQAEELPQSSAASSSPTSSKRAERKARRTTAKAQTEANAASARATSSSTSENKTSSVRLCFNMLSA